MLVSHRLNFLNKVTLLHTSLTILLPIAQNLLQLSNSHLLQVDVLPVEFFLVMKVADLSVLLLQVFADLLGGFEERHRLHDFFEDVGRRLTGASDEETLKCVM